VRRTTLLLLILQLLLCNLALSQTKLRGGPMLDCSGLPCVEVTVAIRKHLRLLIDTGNVSSVLDTAVAKDLGLETTPVVGADGKPVVAYSRAVLPGVKVGDAVLGDVKIFVMDLSDDIKRDRMPAADGTLAYTAFKDRILELDYRQKRVKLSEALHDPESRPGFCGTLTTSTFGKKGPPILVATGYSLNGHDITAQIDTLFSGTMLIYPTSVEKLGLTDAAKTTNEEFFKYTDDGVDMLKTTAATENFGSRKLAENAPLYFATPDVHLPDGMFDGTVGHALFEHSVLTLDLHDMKVWMSE
jgi:predicted aspartyl protease